MISLWEIWRAGGPTVSVSAIWMAPSEMAHLDAPIRIAYLTYLDDPIRMGLSGWPIRMAYLASNLVRSARDGRRATPSGPGLMPHRMPHPIQSGHSWLSGHTVGRTFLVEF